MRGWIVPDWPAPANVRALITTRAGGVSRGPHATMNLAAHVNDDPAAVAENRRLLRAHLPAEPLWLSQVHGVRVVCAEQSAEGIEADAAFSRRPGVVCAVLTADCLPVLLCDEAGTVVGAAHAGWRGLAAGVIEAAVRAMNAPPEKLLAFLGPAIGPRAFEVGAEVREAFVPLSDDAAAAFAARDNGKWLADLYLLARQRLNALGVARVFGGGWCTFTEAERFYSFRRERVTGRMASLVWMGP
ncbi:MAG: peptidoglycan editing factor PgeF [Rhodocyclaceae bacterium]|jgi:YfiH family protein|nr:peptidoglycan editing factor PgeF [Rhodocyclaceae bacterium]